MTLALFMKQVVSSLFHDASNINLIFVFGIIVRTIRDLPFETNIEPPFGNISVTIVLLVLVSGLSQIYHH